MKEVIDAMRAGLDALRADMDAQRAEMDRLRARFDHLRTGHTSADEDGDPFDQFSKSVHDRLRESRTKNSLPYALGIASAVMQTTRSGSTGTALGLWTVDTPADLPDDAQLERRQKRYLALVADPLIPKIFRQFLRLAFDDKPMEATAAELAAALGTTPDTIETLLAPLVEDKTLERGLTSEGMPIYKWGADHRILMMLFQD